MASVVEGEWNGFTIKLIETADLPKVYEHLRETFMKDETTAKLVGYEDEYPKDFQQIYDWMFALNEGLSFIAVDNKTGDIAAARLTYKHTKETDFSKFTFKSKPMLTLFGIISILDHEVDMFEHYGVDHYAMFLSATTSAAYRNRGLATEMYRRALALLREKKFPVVKSVFSSPYSRKCAERYNFETLAVVDYTTHKNEKGELVFPNAKPGDHAALMCLKL